MENEMVGKMMGGDIEEDWGGGSSGLGIAGNTSAATPQPQHLLEAALQRNNHGSFYFQQNSQFQILLHHLLKKYTSILIVIREGVKIS